MSTTINPAAPHHLPPFITAPGQTDYFYNGSAIFIVVMVVVLGTLYFRLHALPEHLAHEKADKHQFQLVGVLALLALFTHNNIFWVAALLLALVPIPDLTTPLTAMADSLAKLVGRTRRTVAAQDDFAAARPSEAESYTNLKPVWAEGDGLASTETDANQTPVNSGAAGTPADPGEGNSGPKILPMNAPKTVS